MPPKCLALQAVILSFFLLGAQAAAAQTRAYLTEMIDGTLKVVDLRRLPVQVLATVPAGDLPLAVAVERHGRYLFVAGLQSGDVTVLDARVMPPAFVTTIALGGELGGIAASPTADRIYAAKFGANQLAVIDSAATPPVVLHTLAVGDEPDGVAVSPDGSQVYVAAAEDLLGTSSQVNVIDATQSPPVLLGSVTVGPEPHGIAIVEKGNVVVPSADAGTVTLLDPVTRQVLDTLTLPDGSRPYAVAATPAGDRVYVTDTDTLALYAIDIENEELILARTHDLGGVSFGVDVLPDGKVAVASTNAQQLQILDFATNPATVASFVLTGNLPASFGKMLAPEPPGFADGFESGTTGAWSLSVP